MEHDKAARPCGSQLSAELGPVAAAWVTEPGLQFLMMGEGPVRAMPASDEDLGFTEPLYPRGCILDLEKAAAALALALAEAKASPITDETYLALAEDIARLTAETVELRRLLARYRDETPLGHQPHMIAHQADAALGRA